MPAELHDCSQERCVHVFDFLRRRRPSSVLRDTIQGVGHIRNVGATGQGLMRFL